MRDHHARQAVVGLPEARNPRGQAAGKRSPVGVDVTCRRSAWRPVWHAGDRGDAGRSLLRSLSECRSLPVRDPPRTIHLIFIENPFFLENPHLKYRFSRNITPALDDDGPLSRPSVERRGVRPRSRIERRHGAKVPRHPDRRLHGASAPPVVRKRQEASGQVTQGLRARYRTSAHPPHPGNHRRVSSEMEPPGSVNEVRSTRRWPGGVDPGGPADHSRGCLETFRSVGHNSLDPREYDRKTCKGRNEVERLYSQAREIPANLHGYDDLDRAPACR